MKQLFFLVAAVFLLSGCCHGQDSVAGTVETVTVDADLGAFSEGSRTDAETLSPEQLAALGGGDSFTFQTEVNRVMKLIINSLYRNKEIFLRELISNASDALDKIRLLSLTDPGALSALAELGIRIKADPEKRQLHIMDSGIGMTKEDLVNNLGTIAKSGTADFLSKMQEAEGAGELNDMIGQFGVGFYSAFLVADRVTVVSKHNDGDQYVWDSDASSFHVARDPRGNTLPRGTHITLHMKEEAADFLQADTIKQLVKKYSQFINFPIYLWASSEETVPVEEDDVKPAAQDDDDDDAQVEDTKEEGGGGDKKTTTRTVWAWRVMNDNKPIWTRKPSDVSLPEYSTFYRALTKDSADPLAHVHFVAEGEVTFRALLFVPRVQPAESFNRYGTRTDHIKLYVRRVFISDEFNDLMPNYLAFVQGIVDSDDLPLNVSRETLQQHKLVKIIKKKLVRKVLDMFKKIPEQDFLTFWKEYSTNIKLGVMEDPSNRSRLAKLLRFHSSHSSSEMTFLEEYVSRMKPAQQHIYYLAGASREEVARSPFAERLAARGLEVLFLTEPVDEYCISSLPEFDGHKFQNIAKELFDMPDEESEKEQLESYKKQLEPLTTWLGSALSEWVSRATVSRRLVRSPAALAAGTFGWTGNMERLALANAHQKADDAQRRHQLAQKKVLELNPRHPLVLELLRRVQDAPDAAATRDAAASLYRVAALRSGYALQGGEALQLADLVDRLLLRELGVDPALVAALAEDTPTDPAPADPPAGDDDDEDDAPDHEEL